MHYYIVPAKKGAVSGRITDAEDGSPLPGVSIAVGKKIFVSSPEGIFYIVLEEGPYDILLSAVGYETKQITAVEIQSGHASSLILHTKKHMRLPDVK